VELLLVLVQAGGNPIEKNQLLQKVWAGTAVEEGSLTWHISLLRKALDDGENGRRFIETIPRRGYRFISPVSEVSVEESPASLQDTRSQVSLAAGNRLKWLWSTALAMSVAGAVYWVWGDGRIGRPAQHSGRIMVAVLPVQNLTGDPEREYISDGLTEEVIANLARLNPARLGVIARTSSMAYKATAKTVQQIGRELQVDFVVESSMRATDDRMRITAELVRVSGQTQLWASSYDRTQGDLFSLQGEVAQAIAREVKVSLLPRARERMERAHLPSPAAYEAYLKGRHFWAKRTEDGLRKGLELFKQAIQQDPAYAAAYVGVSDSYALLAMRGVVPAQEAFPKARTALRRALELDADLGEAHASLAHIRLHEWDWAGLEQEFQRAIELNPGYAMAYPWYSEYLTDTGRFNESIEVVKKARAIDPVSSVVGTTLPHAYYFSRNYKPAMDLLRKTLELEPNHFQVHFRLGQVYIARKLRDEAIQEMQRAVDLSDRSTESMSGLAEAYAAAGMTARSQQLVDELKREARYVSPYAVAKIFACVPDKQEAFTWLDKAYRERDPDLIELAVEPVLDGLRSDPRFSSLLQRLNFPR
jgi:TolB-like protein/Tfp pilus assembly protein PilF